ncbi:uncharacterized protein LOC135272688, partial [Aotus nancymaae]|uniref:uncharacterized protein LOC135272688 n=1 Tax=Aotus nancymaae TaxID=37293 RepID=UPI0030FE7C24
ARLPGSPRTPCTLFGTVNLSPTRRAVEGRGPGASVTNRSSEEAPVPFSSGAAAHTPPSRDPQIPGPSATFRFLDCSRPTHRPPGTPRSLDRLRPSDSWTVRGPHTALPGPPDPWTVCDLQIPGLFAAHTPPSRDPQIPGPSATFRFLDCSRPTHRPPGTPRSLDRLHPEDQPRQLGVQADPAVTWLGAPASVSLPRLQRALSLDKLWLGRAGPINALRAQACVLLACL